MYHCHAVYCITVLLIYIKEHRRVKDIFRPVEPDTYYIKI